jgi:2-polyprenyl-6-hydroxyphenyl methylase / 3-demethylubiquinone-9 3-methyltransferase
MTNASAHTTINSKEAVHFGALASQWWDPKGSSAMLHKLNPVRLGFVRSALDGHFGGDRTARTPLVGKTVLDVGCGAGLLCEPLARLGGTVTGVDAAPENAAAATAHAAVSGLDIDYRSGELSAQGLGKFDVVTCMEVIEHVTDPAAFVGEIAAHLKPDGLLILSTPNRTTASKLFLVEAAERFGQFLTPQELTALLEEVGLHITDMKGIAFSPMHGLHLGESKALNYILSASFQVK